MGTFDMAVKIRPTPTGNVAIGIRTIVPQQQDGIIVDLFLLVPDSEHLIGFLEVAVDKLFIAFRWVVGEDYMMSLRLEFALAFQTCRESQMLYSLDSGHTLVSYIKLSVVERRYDRFDGCRAR